MTREDKPPTKLEISPTQVAGSALAAVSGAFFASWAGTAGTLIGVAAGSMIATVGAATYTWWLRRTRDAVRRRATQARLTALRTNAMPGTVAAGPPREGEETVVLTTGTDPDGPGATEDRRPWFKRWDLPWARVAVASVVVMVIALAGITAFEAVTGRSVASFTGKDDPHGTTLGNAFDKSPATRDTTKNDPAKNTRTTPPTPTTGPSSVPTSGPGSVPGPVPGPVPGSGPTDTATGGTGPAPSQAPASTPSADPTQLPSTDPSPNVGATP